MEVVRKQGRDGTGTTILIQVRPARLLRQLLLGAVVFTMAALTGALLAGAAPAEPQKGVPGNAGTAAFSGAGGGAAATATGQGHRLATDQQFAQSMVYSSSAALILTAVGVVIVARRRRHW